MSKVFFLVVVMLCLAAPATAQTEELVLPAGTVLRCTLAEPKFSSKTVKVGDPIICYLSPLWLFGRPVFPRGAYLAGRFDDFRDPGRFFGKGWIKLEFDRLFLPSTVLPLSARVLSVPRYAVDREGRIRGTGHAWRDLLGWAIPILWPVKVITLPMRGPRPTLKGETRIRLRLLDDVVIPPHVAAASRAQSLRPKPVRPRASTAAIYFSGRWHLGSNRRAANAGLPAGALRSTLEQADFTQPVYPIEDEPSGQLTVVMLKGGRGYAVNDYWVEAGGLHCITYEGNRKVLPLEEIDLAMTVKLNRERGVEFVLRTKPTSY